MTEPEPMIATFVHIGNYIVPTEIIIKRLFKGATVLPPSPITKKTLELGSRHSPDFVCVPFKYNLGNMIESLDKGANTIFQAGGGCRFGFYGELQEQILRDLGYKFTFINLFNNKGFGFRMLYKMAKKAGSNVSFASFAYTFYFTWTLIKIMDKLDFYVRENIGFEVTKNSFDNLQKEFLKEVKTAKKIKDLKRLYKKYNQAYKAIPLNKPGKVFRVALIGELYCLMESASNYDLEKQLAGYNIEIHREINFTYLMKANYKVQQKHIKCADGYIKYHLGADGTHSVATAVKAAKNKFDGIIHLKPFGCMPEVNAMPALINISNDYKIPILYFSFDSQTSETGIKTRLEAFYDMLTTCYIRAIPDTSAFALLRNS